MTGTLLLLLLTFPEVDFQVPGPSERIKAIGDTQGLSEAMHRAFDMFALLHCIHFNCLMNGANYLEEGDRRPLHLCPVCLRKPQSSVDFDVVERYKKLLDFHGKAGLEDEAKWHKERIEWIERGGAKK
jgi:hypothetical protein